MFLAFCSAKGKAKVLSYIYPMTRINIILPNTCSILDSVVPNVVSEENNAYPDFALHASLKDHFRDASHVQTCHHYK